MDVSKNRGTPKWMVKIIEKTYEQMDDLGVFPHMFGSTPIWIHSIFLQLPYQPPIARCIGAPGGMHPTRHRTPDVCIQMDDEMI